MGTYSKRDIQDPESIESIDVQYFTDMLCNHHQHDDMEVLSLESEQMKPGFATSFVGGLIRYRLVCKNKEGKKYEMSLVLKVGAGVHRTSDVFCKLIEKLGYTRLTEISREVLPQILGKGASVNEIMTQRILCPQMPIGTPIIYHTVLDEPTERLWTFMQDLSDHVLIEHPADAEWTSAHEDKVVCDLARLHAAFWDQKETLVQHDWLQYFSAEKMNTLLSFYQEALVAVKDLHGDNIGSKHMQLLDRISGQMEALFTFKETCEHTLVHADFHRGNICFHPETQQAVVFDWGNTAVDVPQYDLFLFILRYHPQKNPERANDLIDIYLRTLSEKLSKTIDREAFMHAFNHLVLRMLFRKVPLSLLRPELGTYLEGNLIWAEHVINDVL